MKALLFLIAFIGSFAAYAKEKKLIFHANGKVKYEYEMDGFLLDGRFSCYYETGKLKLKGQFTKNRKTGLWRVWDENGILRSERKYTDNLEFQIISESDAEGNKLNSSVENIKFDISKQSNPLFMHRFMHEITNTDHENIELFTETGLAGMIMQKILAYELPAYTNELMVEKVNIPALSCYTANEITGFHVYEEYSCYEDDGPVMTNKIIGIAPLVMEDGKQKELGWVPIPSDLFNNEQLFNLKEHQYASSVIKTTVNEPGFDLRTVDHKENEKIRLMLVEFEAAAILYVIDQRNIASNN